MTTPDALISPRIKTLREELAAGKHAALDAFWQEVNRSGTPLIESVTDDDAHVWVTFLWRAKELVEKIRIIRGLTQHDPNCAELFHLPDTDLWYRTFRARSDIRTLYLFLPKGSSEQLDPLNSKTYLYPPDEDNPEQGGEVVSVLELPQAPAQPWVQPQPNIPTGQLERCTLHSSILNNERRIWVYTPPGYTVSGNPYDLLILFDGWAYAHAMHAPVTLDNLIGVGKIPPLVAVMLDSPDRMQELLCYPPFADFLAQELMPWAHQNYHLTNKPTQTIVGGMSAGGLAAAYIGLRYPELFGKVLAQSAALWWRPHDESEPEWLARQFVTGPRLPLRFYLDVGLLEDWTEGDEGVSQLVSTRHLRNVLQAKGYPVHYAEFSGDHDEICWQGTLADGLITLLNEEATSA
jgi:enterochelin esterase family protein